MHVDAVGAAVDLGSPRLDQLDQRMLEAGSLDLVFHRHQRLDGIGGSLVKIHPGLHVFLLLLVGTVLVAACKLVTPLGGRLSERRTSIWIGAPPYNMVHRPNMTGRRRMNLGRS